MPSLFFSLSDKKVLTATCLINSRVRSKFRSPDIPPAVSGPTSRNPTPAVIPCFRSLNGRLRLRERWE